MIENRAKNSKSTASQQIVHAAIIDQEIFSSPMLSYTQVQTAGSQKMLAIVRPLHAASRCCRALERGPRASAIIHSWRHARPIKIEPADKDELVR